MGQVTRKPIPKRPYKSSKSKRGSHKLKVTQEMRDLVERAAGIGIRVEEIAQLVAPGGVSTKTLYRHFKKELKVGKARAAVTVASTAFNMARSARYPAMTMFWLKCQAGWREKPREEERDPMDLAERTRKAINKMDELTTGMEARSD